MKKQLILLLISTFLFSCEKLDTYYKINSIKNATWNIHNTQDFTFQIEDTSAEYHHYFVLRLDDGYDFSNLWVKILVKKPDSDAFTDSFLEEFMLYDKNGYSFGEQQGTFWNYKLSVNNKKLYFKDSGEYTIRLQQIMREDDLNAIMNIGWMIEKKH